MPGVVVDILVQEGELISKGQELVILEAMKMENAIISNASARVEKIHVQIGDVVEKKSIMITYRIEENKSHKVAQKNDEKAEGPDRLEELRKRKKYLEDNQRPLAVQKRRKKGQNTARENVLMLADEGSFKEYGSLIVAAQRSRRSEQDLIENTPADGLITGRGTIHQSLFGSRSSVLIMAYDFTVLAGTQGTMNHMKMDRVLAIAKKRKLPVILFAEGGGGRPGDVDVHTIAGLFISTFIEFAGLRSIVPTISIVSGYCFAGNAALAGSSDLIIATKNISLGMGGPAMIEGGGLGKYHPRDVGPAAVHVENGVIDVLVEDETEAIEIAKKYLGYWQGNLEKWTAQDQSKLQHIIPLNRKRTFDIKSLISMLTDNDSLLELRPGYGKGLLTFFGRVEGVVLGIIANDSSYEAGAITSKNAIKAAQFIRKCNRYGIPILSLVDTPGIMVGPASETHGTVRHAGDLFVAGAEFKPPFVSVVIRKAYGLGAMAMMGGSTQKSEFTVSWPSGEFGAMGLEGAVRLGYRKEFEAITDEKERVKLYDKMVEEAYERGKAMNMATMLEIDEVIEPKDTRSWILMAIKGHER